ncbi:TPA: hypothetical protein DCX16_06665 [bacterium]|nr:hypothetical protein [bacterium]
MNIRKFFPLTTKEVFRYIFLTFFQPTQLRKETSGFSIKERTLSFIQLYLYFIPIIILCFFSFYTLIFFCELPAKYPFAFNQTVITNYEDAEGSLLKFFFPTKLKIEEQKQPNIWKLFIASSIVAFISVFFLCFFFSLLGCILFFIDWLSTKRFIRESLATGLVMGLLVGLLFSLEGCLRVCLEYTLVVDLVMGLLVGLLLGLVVCLAGDLESNLGESWVCSSIVGLLFGLLLGLEFDFGGGGLMRIVWGGNSLLLSSLLGLGVGLLFGLAFGVKGTLKDVSGIVLVFCLVLVLVFVLVSCLVPGSTGSIESSVGCSISFLITFFRLFLYPLYFLNSLYLSLRGAYNSKASEIIKKFPFYFDELIYLPLPGLIGCLNRLIEEDLHEAKEVIRFIFEERPRQRYAGIKAYIYLINYQFAKIQAVESLKDIDIDMIRLQPAISKKIGRLGEPLEKIKKVTETYLSSTSHYYQRLALKEILVIIGKLRDVAMGLSQPLPKLFGPTFKRWEGIVRDEEENIEQVIKEKKIIDNPYILEPVQYSTSTVRKESNLFVGRGELIWELETQIKSSIHKPSILLEGQRRVGKSSILKSLPALMPSNILPIFLDMQDPIFLSGIGPFFDQIIFEIEKNLKVGLKKTKKDFPYHYFGQWLDTLEDYLNRGKKLVLLCFDEYEKIDDKIASKEGGFSVDVLDTMRHIIQHHPSIFILFSGVSDISEMRVNWYSYLINTKTFKVEYLKPEDAWALITNPIPNFPVNYEKTVVDEIIKWTACQPYLLQVLCYEAVNLVNKYQIDTVEGHILNEVIENSMITAQNYFENFLRETCTSNEEREAISTLSRGKKIDPELVSNLIKKEYLVVSNEDVEFRIPLMRRYFQERR